MLTGKPPHLRTFDYTGFHRYSLTFCTDRRRRLFTQHAAVNLVLSQISRAAEEQRFAVLTYCFMPEHVHFLVQGECETADCKRFISLSKQYSGYLYSQTFKEKLWQRYGYERTLRNDEQTLTVARYILNNPVRAGLVRNPTEYPFVGSLVYELKDLLESSQVTESRAGSG
jgi:REP element-mobilizing transposase RayT